VERRHPSDRTRDLRDAAQLAQLHGASFQPRMGRSRFETMLIERKHAGSPPQGRTEGDRLCGVAPRRRRGRDLSIAVAASHRGRGLSRNLLLTHLGHLAGRGVRTVFLEVEENNQPARRLYERAGFGIAGRRERYYRGGEPGNN